MTYLLDVLLWWMAYAPRLQRRVRDLIGNPDQDVVVSVASIREATIKRAAGKLRFETPTLLHALREGRVRLLPITAEHALAAGDLPRHHDDPFDRMLLAKAAAERLSIITHDRRFERYQADVLHA